MAKRSRKVHPIVTALRRVCAALATTGRFIRRHLPLPRRIPIEVVLADQVRRRALKREVARTVRSLQRILGELLPGDVVVVVQQAIPAEQELAGCCQLAQRPDQRRFALIRLALQVDGRRLSTDEVLATLAEQCVGLAMKEAPGVEHRVPVRLQPGERRTSFPPDPLRPLRDVSHDEPEPPAA